jgi:hypothetical protein
LIQIKALRVALQHHKSTEMECVMSFETVVMISAVTEFIVISAISLTLINAFSHGALAGIVTLIGAGHRILHP